MTSQSSFPTPAFGTLSIRNILYNMREHSVLLTGAAVGVTIVLVMKYVKSPWRKLPPGPPGWPLIGNVLQIVGEPWLKYSAWRKQYGTLIQLQVAAQMEGDHVLYIGDIIYLNVAGQPTMVLNNSKVAIELLDRRASIYSDRPPMIVANEILCGGLALPFARYNETCVLHVTPLHD